MTSPSRDTNIFESLYTPTRNYFQFLKILEQNFFVIQLGHISEVREYQWQGRINLIGGPRVG